MHILSVAIGVFSIVYGLTTALARVGRQRQLVQLDSMKLRFGETAGNVIHLIAYTLIPLGVGIVFLLAGLQGRAFF